MDFILEQYAKDNPDKLKFHRAIERETVKDNKTWTRVLHGAGLRKWLGKFTNMDVVEKLAAKAQQAQAQAQATREQMKEPKPIVQRKPPTPKVTRQSKARM